MQTNNKLREALAEILGIADHVQMRFEIPKLADQEISELKQIAKAALAEPVKNCEVGTPKQQAKRFLKFCLGHQPKGGDCTCACPAFVGKDVDCHFSWAQMPHESEAHVESGDKARWQLRVCYYYPDEPWGNTLSTSVQSYASEEVAIKMLEETIRSVWTTTVPDGDVGEVALADRRGWQDDPVPERSEVYYSKDGKTAWAFFSDGHGYKGEVVEV